MIVTCEQCSTQFNLDDAKVPEGGVRVRCTRCDHAFRVESPEVAAADHAEDLAREALGEGSPPAEDTGGSELESESDWQFNDDRPVSATAQTSGGMEAESSGAESGEESRVAASSAVDDLLSFVSTDEGLDASPAPEPVSEVDPPEFDSGEVDWAEPDSAESSDDLAADSQDAAFDLGNDAPPASDARAASEAIAADAPSDDMDMDEEWDLFDSEESTAYVSMPPDEEVRTHVETDAPRLEPQVGLPMPSREGDDALPVWRARIGNAVGWCIVVGLTALGLYRGFAAPAVAPGGLGAWSEAGFEADQIEGRWLETATGQIFVISGRIRRGGSLDADALPFVRILNAAGEPMSSAAAALGRELPSRALREAPPEQLAALQWRAANRFADRLDGWEPFHAIVPSVPIAADRFELDVMPRDARL